MNKKLVKFLSLILLLALLTSCTGSLGAGVHINLDEVHTKLIDGNRDFAFNLFKTLNREDADSNVFISPLSISTALTMTYNGAESTTKQAMEKVLGYEGIDRSVINKGYSALQSYLKQADSKIQFNTANSIWIREGEEIKEQFLQENQSSFMAEIEAVDFSDNKTVEDINGWISEATKGKIDRMLEPPIDPSTIMFLINAIYFKGDWAAKFDEDDTRDADFYTLDGEHKTVDMMNRKGNVEYMKTDAYKAVRLPYGNEKISMYCILPDEDIHINDFIDSFNADEWQNIKAKMTETEDVILQIPRFKIEYGIKELKDSLIELGMEEAFDERADFSGIRENIFISGVFHKAVIEVNEEGSEAAAATVVEMREASAILEPISFIADRPFMFLICDDITDTILFMGKYGKL